MQQAFLVLNTKGNILDGRTAAILEMLTNLVIDSEENQAMLKSSRCLSKILDIFRTFDFEVCAISCKVGENFFKFSNIYIYI